MQFRNIVGFLDRPNITHQRIDAKGQLQTRADATCSDGIIVSPPPKRVPLFGSQFGRSAGSEAAFGRGHPEAFA